MEVVRELPLDQVLLGDCVRMMGMLPPASIHCVFADPPYNLQLRGELRRPDDSLVDGVDDDWDRFTDFAEYDAFTRSWLEECRRLLRKDGTIWVIGAYHNIFRIGAILQDLGFWILNDIVWRKSNPMPNFRGRRFTNAHETLIWAARGRDSRYKLNYHAMKALNDDVQMRSDWLLPLCTGTERLRNQHGLKLAPDPEAGGVAAPRAARFHRAGRHRARPVPLARGRRPPVAKRLGRHFIGIERHPAYAEAAIGRVRKEKSGSPGRARHQPLPPRHAARIVRQLRRDGDGFARLPSCGTARVRSPPRCWPTALWSAARIPGRSTKWAPPCRTHHPATAGRSGTCSGMVCVIPIDILRQPAKPPV